MEAHTTAPRPSAGWLLPAAGAAGCAVLALLVVSWRRRARRRPSVTPMSHAWLQSYAYEAGQHEQL